VDNFFFFSTFCLFCLDADVHHNFRGCLPRS
jgi:hypothetical protein